MTFAWQYLTALWPILWKLSLSGGIIAGCVAIAILVPGLPAWTRKVLFYAAAIVGVSWVSYGIGVLNEHTRMEKVYELREQRTLGKAHKARDDAERNTRPLSADPAGRLRDLDSDADNRE